MPDIGNIGSTSSYGVGPINRSTAEIAQRSGQTTAAEVRRSESLDRVELSDHARHLDALRSMPPVRTEKVAQIKAAIAAGSYETDERLSIALDRMIAAINEVDELA